MSSTSMRRFRNGDGIQVAAAVPIACGCSPRMPLISTCAHPRSTDHCARGPKFQAFSWVHVYSRIAISIQRQATCSDVSLTRSAPGRGNRRRGVKAVCRTRPKRAAHATLSARGRNPGRARLPGPFRRRPTGPRAAHGSDRSANGTGGQSSPCRKDQPVWLFWAWRPAARLPARVGNLGPGVMRPMSGTHSPVQVGVRRAGQRRPRCGRARAREYPT